MTNHKKYWMKRRRYGWGWIPTTWQGWLFLIFQLGIVLAAAFMLPAKPAQPTTAQQIGFWSILILAIGSLVVVAASTSPRPRWRWGKKDTDNPDEDF